MFIRTTTGAWTLVLALALTLPGQADIERTTDVRLPKISPVDMTIAVGPAPLHVAPPEQVAKPVDVLVAVERTLNATDDPLAWLETTRRAVLHLRAAPDREKAASYAQQLIETLERQAPKVCVHPKVPWIPTAPVSALDLVRYPALPPATGGKRMALRLMALGYATDLLTRTGLLEDDGFLAPPAYSFDAARRAHAMPEIDLAAAIVAPTDVARTAALRRAAQQSERGSLVDNNLAHWFGRDRIDLLREPHQEDFPLDIGPLIGTR